MAVHSARPAPRPARRAAATGSPWLGGVLCALAMAVAAVSLLGPLVTGVIEWRITPAILSQLYGLDAVSLGIVAPLALVAGVLSRRDASLGAVLGFGPAVYATYMVPQYVLGPDYLGLPGNNERWFPLLLLVFILGLVATALAWGSLRFSVTAVSPGIERLAGRWLLPAAAVLVFIRYPAGLADWMSARPTAQDYLAGPTFGWTIALLDLGIALPATVAVCIGYRRGFEAARRGLYAILGWYALVGTAVAAMAIAMQSRGEPSMTVGQMAFMTALGTLLVSLAAGTYAALGRSRRLRTSASPSSPR